MTRSCSWCPSTAQHRIDNGGVFTGYCACCLHMDIAMKRLGQTVSGVGIAAAGFARFRDHHRQTCGYVPEEETMTKTESRRYTVTRAGVCEECRTSIKASAIASPDHPSSYGIDLGSVLTMPCAVCTHDVVMTVVGMTLVPYTAEEDPDSDEMEVGDR